MSDIAYSIWQGLIATKVAGTADAWTSKTVLDLVRAVRVEVAAKVQ